MHPKDLEAGFIALGSEAFIIAVVAIVVLAIFGGIVNLCEKYSPKGNKYVRRYP